jgi:hypothetical protein
LVVDGVAWTVTVDGDEVGQIRDGETRRYPLTPRAHTVRIRFATRFLRLGKLFTSRSLQIEARDGVTVTLTCSPDISPAGVLNPHRRIRLVGPSGG